LIPVAVDELPDAVLASKDVRDAHHQRRGFGAARHVHLGSLDPDGVGQVAALAGGQRLDADVGAPTEP